MFQVHKTQTQVFLLSKQICWTIHISPKRPLRTISVDWTKMNEKPESMEPSSNLEDESTKTSQEKLMLLNPSIRQHYSIVNGTFHSITDLIIPRQSSGTQLILPGM